MKSIFKFITLSLFALVGFSCASSPKSPLPISMCLDQNRNFSSVGDQCKSSKGAIFEIVKDPRIGKAWKDQNGRLWSKAFSAQSEEEGLKICAELKADLPTDEDFISVDRLGYREINSKLAQTWLWTQNSLLIGRVRTFSPSTGQFSMESERQPASNPAMAAVCVIR